MSKILSFKSQVGKVQIGQIISGFTVIFPFVNIKILTHCINFLPIELSYLVSSSFLF